jgi:uncharacterized protein YbjT (DUF2867 family)
MKTNQYKLSRRDALKLAGVAAAALAESGHAGKTCDLTGPSALMHAEMTAELPRC